MYSAISFDTVESHGEHESLLNHKLICSVFLRVAHTFRKVTTFFKNANLLWSPITMKALISYSILGVGRAEARPEARPGPRTFLAA